MEMKILNKTVKFNVVKHLEFTFCDEIPEIIQILEDVDFGNKKLIANKFYWHYEERADIYGKHPAVGFETAEEAEKACRKEIADIVING
jgi:hypothetical protein